MMLFAGFPRGDTSEYTLLLNFIDADISEAESLTEGTWFGLNITVISGWVRSMNGAGRCSDQWPLISQAYWS